MHAQSHRGDEVRNVLVDFGYTADVLLNNLSILKIDPAGFDALVLSHGHYDHFGGMVGFSPANKGVLKRKMPLRRRRGLLLHQAQSRRELRRARPPGDHGGGLALMMAEGPALVADHAFTTGRIAQSSFEKPLLPTRRSSASSTASAASGRCRRRRASANTSRTISTTRSRPATWSRARAWWC
jgi:7,8-dihydropterin-6-yl-methyl-4-(beta-D-ribofuranosyl)aminobenzene 5'-phosphate synthase